MADNQANEQAPADAPTGQDKPEQPQEQEQKQASQAWDDSIEQAEMPPLQEDKPDHSGNGKQDQMALDFLLDIPLTVTVEVGRTKMLINDLLQLGQGSVIELNKLVGEPFEIMVNDKLIARGEVVVVNERFGVRLTDIVSPMERIQSLT